MSTAASRPWSEIERRAGFKRLKGERDLAGLGPTLARSGSLEARLAETKRDIRRAQELRYRVFFEEGTAVPDKTSSLIRRDVCRFDAVCDHLLVVDHAARSRRDESKVVGVYRLLRQEIAERHFGFYSAGEFEVAALTGRRPDLRFLEVGRACVATSHRGRHVLDLLWRGLWTYARHHQADVLIGCASLAGADPAAHLATVRALAAGGDEGLRANPRPDRAVALDGFVAPSLDRRALARVLPPLVKGYWRLGATFSPDLVADPAFGSTDMFVALPLDGVERRFLEHFGVAEDRAALAA